MPFTDEERKEVFDFWVKILEQFNGPVHYMKIRGYVSQAPPSVKRYVLHRCKGENFLDFFRIRHKYFIVDKEYISLKDKLQNPCKDDYFSDDENKDHNNTTENKFKKRSKSRSRQSSESNSADYVKQRQSEHLSQDDDEEREQYEKNAIKFKKRSKSRSRQSSESNSADYVKQTQSEYLSQDDEEREKYEKNAIKFKKRSKSRSRQSSESNSADYVKQQQSEHLSQDDEEREKYVEIAIKYFVQYLKRNKKFPVDSFDLSNSNKKIQRLIEKYYKKKLRYFFLSFPDVFCIDNEDYVVMRCSEENTVKETKDVNPDELKQNETTSKAIPLEIKSAMNYYASLQFFVDILHQKPLPFPIDRLSGYLSQADKEIRDHVKYNYKSFTNFFEEAPKIFQVNKYHEVSLSPNCSKLLKFIKRLLNKAVDNSLEPFQLNLKSHMDVLLKGKGKQDTSVSSNSCENVNVDGITDVCAQIKVGTEVNLMQGKTCKANDMKNDENAKLTKLLDKDKESDKLNEMGNGVNHEDLEGSLLKTIFSVELYCASIIESQHWFLDQSEIEAVKYFRDIVETGWISNIRSLQGHLGRASDEVRRFINKYYKNEKFKDFFLKHSEVFSLKSNDITLAATHKNFILDEKSDINSLESDSCDEDIIKLIYEDSYFKELKTELFAYLYEVVYYLKFKDKVKLSRITDLRLRFPHCNEWIKLMEGDSLIKKTINFLRMFHIFTFSSDEYISFCCNNHSSLLLPWLEETSDLYQKHNSVAPPFFLFQHAICTPNSVYEEASIKLSKQCIQTLNQTVKAYLESYPFIEYHALPIILPKKLLVELHECKKDSSAILLNLLSKDFKLKKGKVKVNCPDKKDNNHTNSTAKELQSSLLGVESVSDTSLSDYVSLCDSQEDFGSVKKENEIFDEFVSLETANANSHEDVSIDLMSPSNSYQKNIEVSGIRNSDYNETTSSQSFNCAEITNSKECSNPDLYSSITEKSTIYISDELLDFLNKHKMSGNASAENAHINSISENRTSDKIDTVDNSKETHLNTLNEKDLIVPTENNSRQSAFDSSMDIKTNNLTIMQSGKMIESKIDNKTLTESSSVASINNRQKSDSGFEEPDFVESDKIADHAFNSRSSSSSFQNDAETMDFSDDLNENDPKFMSCVIKSFKKEIAQSSSSSPSCQTNVFGADSDSDSFTSDCDINMFLKECIRTTECSSFVSSNKEEFLDDRKLAEWLSRCEDDTSEVNFLNLKNASDENIYKNPERSFERNAKENINFTLSKSENATEANDSNCIHKYTPVDEFSKNDLTNNDQDVSSEKIPEENFSKKDSTAAKIVLNNNSGTISNEVCKQEFPAKESLPEKTLSNIDSDSAAHKINRQEFTRKSCLINDSRLSLDEPCRQEFSNKNSFTTESSSNDDSNGPEDKTNEQKFKEKSSSNDNIREYLDESCKSESSDKDFLDDYNLAEWLSHDDENSSNANSLNLKYAPDESINKNSKLLMENNTNEDISFNSSKSVSAAEANDSNFIHEFAPINESSENILTNNDQDIPLEKIAIEIFSEKDTTKGKFVLNNNSSTISNDVCKQEFPEEKTLPEKILSNDDSSIAVHKTSSQEFSKKSYLYKDSRVPLDELCRQEFSNENSFTTESSSNNDSNAPEDKTNEQKFKEKSSSNDNISAYLDESCESESSDKDFLDDCNLAEWLSHDDENSLNANSINLKYAPDESINKNSKLLMENSTNEDINSNSSKSVSATEANDSGTAVHETSSQEFSRKSCLYKDSRVSLDEPKKQELSSNEKSDSSMNETRGQELLEENNNKAFSAETFNKDSSSYTAFKSKLAKCSIIEKSHGILEKENATLDDNHMENKGCTNDVYSFINYPLQPLTAEVVLLTTNSCMALTNIDSRMQSIYFLKSVFFCENHEPCSTCFDLLTTGDKVSCFVPLTEVSQKVWIAFMVSKETITNLDRMQHVNEVLMEQVNESSSLKSFEKLDDHSCILTASQGESLRNTSSDANLLSSSGNCVYPGKASIETQTFEDDYTVSNSSSCENCNKSKVDACCSVYPEIQHFYCQTEYSCADIKCQTLLSGEVKETVNTDEVAVQTFSSAVSLKNVSVQACEEMIHCGAQTDANLECFESKSTQTDSLEVERIETSCQSELSGDVKPVIKTCDSYSQTIATGNIMITEYYHL